MVHRRVRRDVPHMCSAPAGMERHWKAAFGSSVTLNKKANDYSEQRSSVYYHKHLLQDHHGERTALEASSAALSAVEDRSVSPPGASNVVRGAEGVRRYDAQRESRTHDRLSEGEHPYA